MVKPLKILIADDEALLRLDLREMLEEAGHTVAGEAKHCCAWTCGKCWKKRDTPSQAKRKTEKSR